MDYDSGTLLDKLAGEGQRWHSGRKELYVCMFVCFIVYWPLGTNYIDQRNIRYNVNNIHTYKHTS